jgi:RHS repeat-associated protein
MCCLGNHYKFIGKERDTESNLDAFGARFYGSSLGRFTSADEFWKDSHVGDPQSWNKYAYARNNPLRYVDAGGEKATVTTNCTTDNQHHTTCNVSVSASIAIYAVGGSELSQGQLDEAASTIKSNIETAWSGTFTQDGVTYNVSTQVDISIAGSEKEAMKSGAQNVIGLDIIPADPKHGADSFVRPRRTLDGPDTGQWNFLSLDRSAAHEFEHLLGVGDRDSGFVLADHNPTFPRPNHATSQDFRWALGDVISAHSALNGSPNGFGGLVPRMEGSSTLTVRPPWLWWK